MLQANGVSDAKIQRVSNKDLGSNVVQISTEQLQPTKVQTIRARLDQRFGGTRTSRATSVGPTFGRTVANNAIVAIIASLLVISAYIALRFQWKFAVPVLIALMHDLLITSGIYSLTGREVTSATVAALLTILGYSLYDTIIVFDRIRENMPRMPRAAFSQIANRSMSEVLTRSLATSFSTALPILALMLFGGETLRDFAFALLVGVISGAYSSIFIATPVLTHVEGARAGLHGAPRADRGRERRRRAGLRGRHRRRRTGRGGARGEARAAAPAPHRAGRADGALRRGVRGAAARPRRRRRSGRRAAAAARPRGDRRAAALGDVHAGPAVAPATPDGQTTAARPTSRRTRAW